MWILFIYCLIGYLCGYMFFSKQKTYHGPNSREWREKIIKIGDLYYQWDIDICVCPCF